MNNQRQMLMLRTIILSIIITLLSSSAATGQTDERILIRVNETEVTAEEFIRLYTKNRNIEESPDFEEYFNQFLVFRLKVEQAIDEGLDTVGSFKQEFEGYRAQLARNYLTDNEAREAVMRKAWERLNQELNAFHILVNCRPEAHHDDTLIAHRKAIEIKARIIQGEPFEQIARAVSDDPSVVSNGGNLGWFTALQMIQQFEDIVYSMKPGELSDPVRTPFGYHIIKLEGVRPSRGMIRVAHIMKAVPPGAGEEAWITAGDEIVRIRELIAGGESFEDIASKESDHRESASKGGELDWFGAGDIVQEFSDAAFALQKDGDISEPVRTPYGWHIIKRLERKPLGSFEENRALLEARLSESHMNSIARQSMVDKLKKEYGFSMNHTSLEWFITNTDSMISSGRTRLDRTTMPSGNIFEFEGGRMTCGSLADLIEQNIKTFDGVNTRIQLMRAVEENAAEMLIRKEDSMLEEKYPDFRYLVKEFHDGMLLFEINSREVWNKPYVDTAGLYKFYLEKQDSYMSNPSADAKIYSLRKPGIKVKPLTKMVSKYGSREGGDKKILDRYITGGDTNLVITTGRWQVGDHPKIDRHLKKRGTNNIQWNGMASVLLVEKTWPSEPMPFEEVRMDVAMAYQNHLEEYWIAQLKKRYPVWVNETLLEELRLKLDGKM